jgi:hypothetical protein
LKLGGPQNEAERIGGWYRSNVNMKNLPKLYKIRNRKKPILDPGATMHQQAEEYTEEATQESRKKQAQPELAKSRYNDSEAVDQLFGANKVEIKQKKLETLRLLRQADQALNKVCKYFDNLTKDL